MNYSFFLFTQLYNCIVGIQYEYDIMFEDLERIFSEYELSEFNDGNKPEYECMVNFLKHKDGEIRSRCYERGLCLQKVN